MKIIKATTPDKLKIYNMTKAPDIAKMSNVTPDEIIIVKNWCEFEDENSDGDLQNLLSIEDDFGIVRATNSVTFQREFKAIMEITEKETDFTIAVHTGTTKAGRPFISALLKSL